MSKFRLEHYSTPKKWSSYSSVEYNLSAACSIEIRTVYFRTFSLWCAHYPLIVNLLALNKLWQWILTEISSVPLVLSTVCHRASFRSREVSSTSRHENNCHRMWRMAPDPSCSPWAAYRVAGDKPSNWPHCTNNPRNYWLQRSNVCWPHTPTIPCPGHVSRVSQIHATWCIAQELSSPRLFLFRASFYLGKYSILKWLVWCNKISGFLDGPNQESRPYR